MDPRRIVLTTAGSQEEAKKIAQALVERKLAACVNVVGPIDSVYRWKNQVESAAEFLLIIKTTADAFERVSGAIRELHSYELPECVAIGVESGSSEYLNWISENVTLG
jgi:periplasmic divalent cation tolerance protein